MKKVVILGAGISGLAVAWFLKKKYNNRLALTIYEKSARVGGWIRTNQHQGFLFEEGPRGFRPTGKGKATIELIQELGLENELVSASTGARKRYISLGGKLHPFSLGFLLRQGAIGAALHDLFTPATVAEDETIENFICRRFNRQLADTLFDPLTKGIFGGDCRTLSMRSCLPRLWKLEQQKGSVLRGAFRALFTSHARVHSFKEGMEILPKVLAKKLDIPILFSKKVHSLEEIEADYVISAIPTSSLSPLTHQVDPLEYATLSTINFGWNKKVLDRRGYGFLVPSIEQGEILGMSWDSEIFPTHNRGEQTRICVMIGGNLPEEQLYDIAVKSLYLYLKITVEPIACSIHRAQSAIPQYSLYYHQRIENFKKGLPSRVYAIGNCFDGVGVNECIFNAKKFANTVSF